MARSKLAVWSFMLVLVAYLFILFIFIGGDLMSTSDMGGGFAISGAVLLGGIMGIATLIMSIISLVRIKKQKLKGKGLAIATIILSSILILAYVYISFIAPLVFRVYR